MEIDREAIAQVFLAESEEHLHEMEEALIALENSPEDQESLQTIFRVVHTIKGNASCLGFQYLTNFTHVLEDMLDQLRKRQIPVATSLITLLLQSVDALREIIPDTVSGNESIQPAHSSLLNHLTGYASPALEAGPSNDLPEVERVAETGPARPSHLLGRSGTLRIDIEKLDRMLTLTSEISIARERLKQTVGKLDARGGQEILEADLEVDRLYLELQEMIMKIRMVPVGPIFRRYIRTVRDLAATHGKLARLDIEGADVEADTRVIEQLTDPLTHMIRNAIDHGIEPAELRQSSGKDPCGRITLRACHDSGSIVIQLSDDGCGLNRKRILERARLLRLIADASEMTDQEVFQLIFKPGFSTSENVTDLSGRGIGMDVVRRNIESLRGIVELDSREGEGTTISIRLPLTLAIIDGFKVGVSRETYIIPMEAVIECLEMPEEARNGPHGSGIINLREQPLPFIRLRDMFALGSSSPDRENIVVVQHNDKKVGILVDAVLGESQAVIKPLGKMFRGVSGISGSTILGNGAVALILDVPALLRQAVARPMETI